MSAIGRVREALSFAPCEDACTACSIHVQVADLRRLLAVAEAASEAWQYGLGVADKEAMPTLGAALAAAEEDQ